MRLPEVLNPERSDLALAGPASDDTYTLGIRLPNNRVAIAGAEASYQMRNRKH